MSIIALASVIRFSIFLNPVYQKVENRTDMWVWTLKTDSQAAQLSLAQLTLEYMIYILYILQQSSQQAIQQAFSNWRAMFFSRVGKENTSKMRINVTSNRSDLLDHSEQHLNVFHIIG